MKSIEKAINKLDLSQLKEAKKGVSMAKAILPVISSTSRLYGKDIVEEADKFFQNPTTYTAIQSTIIEFIEKIKSGNETVTKGIFLSVVNDNLNVACIQVTEDSVVTISEIEIDGQQVNSLSFYELISYLGVDKIQLKGMLNEVDTLIKTRMEQLKEEDK